MNLKPKLIGVILICSSVFTLAACTSQGPMRASEQTKPGFSNITDVPLPQSANMNMSKTMVMGGDNSWTGHLVYDTAQPQAEVVDFTNAKMVENDWTRVSELRGKNTVLTYIKDKRVATISIMTEKGYVSQQTEVTIDMSNSKLHTVKTAVIKKDITLEEDETDEA